MRTLALPARALVGSLTLDLVERDLVPDAVIRAGIRRVLAGRRAALDGGVEAAAIRERAFVDALSRGPITVHTREANEQHYELPPAFFACVLGPHRKYSCCLFEGEPDSPADDLG